MKLRCVFDEARVFLHIRYLFDFLHLKLPETFFEI